MKRIALGLEYDGSHYHGWQRQLHASSVQEEVERALSQVANGHIRIICAGRTDTGVHATEQIIHFDSEIERRMRGWVLGSNSHLPRQVSILWAKEVSEDFHARFEAVRRSYRYIIDNRKIRPGILAGKVTWIREALEVDAMNEAGKALVGTHDFSSYRALGCQAKSPVRTIYSLDVSRSRHYIYLDITANAFLHHMVRNIVGVLVAIGSARREVSWATEVLERKDRRQGGVTAKPDGLYLSKVSYPDRFELPSSPKPISFG